MAGKTKYVYFFGAGQTEGNANMRELLGGKGANLAEMAGLGLPVPQGFTISTEACTRYYDDGRMIADDIMQQVMEYVGKLEKSAGKKFGDAKNPLLVSVRSGARASMPGMMDIPRASYSPPAYRSRSCGTSADPAKAPCADRIRYRYRI